MNEFLLDFSLSCLMQTSPYWEPHLDFGAVHWYLGTQPSSVSTKRTWGFDSASDFHIRNHLLWIQMLLQESLTALLGLILSSEINLSIWIINHPLVSSSSVFWRNMWWVTTMGLHIDFIDKLLKLFQLIWKTKQNSTPSPSSYPNPNNPILNVAWAGVDPKENWI